MGIRRVGTAFFSIGLILALVIGVVFGGMMDLWENIAIIAMFWALFAFGLIAGFLNFAKEDTEDILYTVAILLLAALAAGELSRIASPGFGNIITGAAKGIIAFVFPVALVLGAKRVWDLGTGF